MSLRTMVFETIASTGSANPALKSVRVSNVGAKVENGCQLSVISYQYFSDKDIVC